jgi:hypothetical protein
MKRVLVLIVALAMSAATSAKAEEGFMVTGHLTCTEWRDANSDGLKQPGEVVVIGQAEAQAWCPSEMFYAEGVGVCPDGSTATGEVPCVRPIGPVTEVYKWFLEVGYGYMGDGVNNPTLGIGRKFTIIGDLGMDLSGEVATPVTKKGWRQALGLRVFVSYNITDQIGVGIGYHGQVSFGDFSFSRTDQMIEAEFRWFPHRRFGIFVGGAVDWYIDTAQYASEFYKTWQVYTRVLWYFN